MKKGLFFLCTLAFAFCSAKAQSTVHKVLNVGTSTIHISDIHQMADHSMVAVINDETTDLTHLVAKLDASGNVVWTKQIPMTGTSQRLTQAGPLPDGNIYVLGQYVDATGWVNILVQKLSPVGDVIWSRNFQTRGSSTYYVDSKLNVGATGHMLISPSMFNLAGVIEIDASGNKLLAKSETCEDSVYKDPGFESSLLDNGNSIETGKDNSDLFYNETDTHGDIVWSKKLNNNKYNRIYSILQLPDHTLLMAGMEADASYANPVGVLIHTSATGDILFHKLYKVSGMDCFFSGVSLLPGGNYALFGEMDVTGASMGKRPFVMQVNPAGAVQSCKALEVNVPDHTGIFTSFAFAFDYRDGMLAMAGFNEFTLTDINFSGLCNIHDATYTVTDFTEVAPASSGIVRNSDDGTMTNPDIILSTSAASTSEGCKTTGIETVAHDNLVVFPSVLSSKESFTVKGEVNTSSVKVDMISMDGRNVMAAHNYSATELSSGVSCNAEELQSGLYIVRVLAADGSVLGMQKVMVK